jgi:hypothetical protein
MRAGIARLINLNMKELCLQLYRKMSIKTTRREPAGDDPSIIWRRRNRSAMPRLARPALCQASPWLALGAYPAHALQPSAKAPTAILARLAGR